MIARVPSIGSTMIRQRAASSDVPRGSTTWPPSIPSAIRTSGVRGATSREKKSTSVASLTRSTALIVSPASSAAIPDISSSDARSHASTTARRTSSCSSRIGARKSWMVFMVGAWSLEAGAEARPLSPCPLVMDGGHVPQLRGLLLRRRIAQEVASPDLRPGQVLQQVGFAERRMELDVEVEAGIIMTVSRGLVQRHDIGKRHLPQVVEPDEHLL